MFQLVRQYGTVVDSAGGVYQARAYGEPRADGSWDGWLVFVPIGADTPVATDRETTQNSLANLVRWSSTVGSVYLEGALERALQLQPGASISARLAELALFDREAVEDAAVLETAAAQAHADSDAAARDAAVHERAATVARTEAQERAEDARALDREVAIIEESSKHASGAGSEHVHRLRSQAAATPRRRSREKKK
jgi:hypothetical protein